MFSNYFPSFGGAHHVPKKGGKEQLSIAAELHTSCHVVVFLPYEDIAGLIATAKEPESPGGKGPPHPCAYGMWISAKDSHGLCISCLGTKHAWTALSNPEGCPHCSKFFVKTQDGAEDGSRVACSGKTLQFFVCFICFFVVLCVRCC